MKSFKYLAIAVLMVSASAVVASQPSSPRGDEVGYLGKAAMIVANNRVTNHVVDLATSKSNWGKLRLAGYGLLAWYGITKVSDTAKSAWNKVRLNYVTDKIEDTVLEAKDNPVSKEGTIVGATTVAMVVGYTLYKRCSDK